MQNREIKQKLMGNKIMFIMATRAISQPYTHLFGVDIGQAQTINKAGFPPSVEIAGAFACAITWFTTLRHTPNMLLSWFEFGSDKLN
jgi:hypothetical protein